MNLRTFLTGDPICSPRTDGSELWVFNSPVGFRDSDGREWWITVPLISDGASIPKPLRVIFGHPFRSNYIRGAALHDYFYCKWAKVFGATGSGASNARAAVDWMLYQALLEDGVGQIRAALMYRGVQMGGWVAWKNHATCSHK